MIKIFLQPNASLDTANAQVTAISQTYLRQLPTGAQPPLILNFSASTVPILQLALSGQGLSEQQLNDLGLNFLRPQLITVPGAAVPYPYGGKQAQIMINLNNSLLQAKGLSPSDIVTMFAQQNLVVPSGTIKIGEFEYDVPQNASPRTVAELNDLPIKQVGSATVYLRDVAQVSDGFAPQTNIVRHDGMRGVLMTVLKTGSASTLAIVQGIRDLLPRVAATLPSELNIQPLRIRRLRPCRHKRRHPRSRHRCVPHGPDDLALPGQLAQHAHHCGFHSAVHPDLYHCPQL
jgi:multidrug efflux pump subunit AcrB